MGGTAAQRGEDGNPTAEAARDPETAAHRAKGTGEIGLDQDLQLRSRLRKPAEVGHRVQLGSRQTMGYVVDGRPASEKQLTEVQLFARRRAAHANAE